MKTNSTGFKTFKIITFGCRVNQAESRTMGEKIINQFSSFQLSKKQKADIVIINSCCVTNKAEKEIRKQIRKVKRENPDCFLIVTGCWAEKIKNEKAKSKISRENKAVLKLINLLLKNKQKNNIANILASVLKEKISITRSRSWSRYRKNRQKNGIKSIGKYTGKYIDKYGRSKKALIKVQTGCNNFCSYCIVPYVRGRSKSRPADEIIKEIKNKVKEGIEEVVLTGVDIADYNFQFSNKFQIQNSNIKNNLVKLILLILRETKIKKISFGSLGWEVVDKEFVRMYQAGNLLKLAGRAEVDTNFYSIFKSRAKKDLRLVESSAQRCKHKNFHKNCILPRVQPKINNLQFVNFSRLTTHFHLPLQSGCNATLKRMKRKYNIENCQLKIENLQKHIANFSFSTDIIVGFPGETEKEFQQTLGFLQWIKNLLKEKFTHIHCFRYSPKQGTLAAKMENKWGKVAEKEKKNRLAKVLSFVNH